MFLFRQRKTRPKPEINITPLVDVVLQLVIFFLVTTTFVSMETGAQVNLPSANFSRIEEAKTLTLTITENNSLYVDGGLVDWVELPKVLVAALRQDPEVMVVIEADRKVLHGTVVRVMDIARQAGAERMAIATQPEGGEE
ncbi:MAG: ExbD/TolR family protein [Candidatus Caldatribacteriaceae bacterium]